MDPALNVMTLSVQGGLPGHLDFRLQRELEAVLAFDHRVDRTWSDLAEDPYRVAELVPLPVQRELRQWALDQTTPGILAIVAPDSELDQVAWEMLPRLLGLPSVLVVRLLHLAERHAPVPRAGTPHILAAGWSGRPWLSLPGIQQELNALSQINAGSELRWRVLSEPMISELADAYSAAPPLILHLIPPGVGDDDGLPVILVSGTDEPRWLHVTDLLAQLPAGEAPQLVVLNACHSGVAEHGTAAARVVTATLGSTTIGWLGPVDDKAAVDFALFFYNRIAEGMNVVDAVRSYLSLQLQKKSPTAITRGLALAARPALPESIPVIWTSSVPALFEPLPLAGRAGARSEQRDDAARGRPASARRGQEQRPSEVAGAEEQAPARIDVSLEPQKWLNPALLLNGQAAITQLTLTQDRPLARVSVVVTCDTGTGASTVRQMLDLERGLHPIAARAFEFPALHQLIQDDVPRRRINFTVTCSQGGRLLAETTTSALWMGRAEWLDRPETWHYIPAFVQPNSEGVLDVIDQAIPMLRTLVSPQSSFCGYQAGGAPFVDKQVEAIFNALRSGFELDYISPPPLHVYTSSEQVSSGQRVRWPADVIARKRGTCHDLAILVASCLEHVGIHPLVNLVTAHTFVGYWRDAKRHGEFWEAARNDIKRQGPGREWTITDSAELQRLIDDGAVAPLEATSVTQRNATFADAVAEGNHRLGATRFDVAVDVRASRHRVQPL